MHHTMFVAHLKQSTIIVQDHIPLLPQHKKIGTSPNTSMQMKNKESTQHTNTTKSYTAIRKV
jgi:hypothetical protein